MALAAEMVGALQQPFVRAFFAVQIRLSTGNINLVDASCQVNLTINSEAVLFTGEDPIYGTLANIDVIKEAMADSAPQTTVTVYPASLSGLAALSAIYEQGAPILIWFCVLSEATGVLISQELVFNGLLDTVKTTDSETSRICEITVSSCFENMFTADEGEKLNAVSHKNVWPGETGLDLNIEAMNDPWWGSDTQTPPVTTLPSVLTANDILGGYRGIPSI